MASLLYFENNMGRIIEHPHGYALLRYQSGKRSLADVQEFLTHTGRLLQLRSWYKILSDQRLLMPFSEEEQALILDFWQARHFSLGATIGAVLLSHNVFTRLSFHQIQEQAQGSLRYRHFEQETDADGWLTKTNR
jgi:hypothetical protein